jgi:hypothetical protein
MKSKISWMLRVITGVAALLLFGCGGSSPTPPPTHASTWTWVSGAKTPDQAGVYGTQGTASPSNMPGSRQFAVSWRDSTGNFWLFAGDGLDSNGTQHDLNDLWKFDGTNWTWVSGSNLVQQPGVYGTKGVASPSNVPGARDSAVSWIDKSNNLWLFGGSGRLNDLWKFDGASGRGSAGRISVSKQACTGPKARPPRATPPVGELPQFPGSTAPGTSGSSADSAAILSEDRAT